MPGFGAGAAAKLVTKSALGYPDPGLTDAGNLCGSLEFAQKCGAAGLQAVFGVDLQVREMDGTVGPVPLLAVT